MAVIGWLSLGKQARVKMVASELQFPHKIRAEVIYDTDHESAICI